MHQIQRRTGRALWTRRAPGDRSCRRQADSRASITSQHLRRPDREVPHAEVERIAFSAVERIASLNDFRAARGCDRRRVVAAVVGHHQQAIARDELCRDGAKRVRDHQRFVVRRDQDRDGGTPAAGISRRR